MLLLQFSIPSFATLLQLDIFTLSLSSLGPGSPSTQVARLRLHENISPFLLITATHFPVNHLTGDDLPSLDSLTRRHNILPLLLATRSCVYPKELQRPIRRIKQDHSERFWLGTYPFDPSVARSCFLFPFFV